MAYLGLLERTAAKAITLTTSEEIAAYRLRADIYMKLLNKALPDLKAIEHSGAVGMTRPDELTDTDLADIATGGSERAATETPSTSEPTELH